MKKALFLDRDGIINIDKKYLHKAEDVEFVDGIFDLCKCASELGYLIFVITNQSGIARGYYSLDDVEQLHEWMREEFALRGVELQSFYVSPYHPEATIEKFRRDSECRKPEPGMVLQAAREHDLDLLHSVMIGDKQSDRIKIGGLRSFVVKSDYVPIKYDLECIRDLIPVLERLG